MILLRNKPYRQSDTMVVVAVVVVVVMVVVAAVVVIAVIEMKGFGNKFLGILSYDFFH